MASSLNIASIVTYFFHLYNIIKFSFTLLFSCAICYSGEPVIVQVEFKVISFGEIKEVNMVRCFGRLAVVFSYTFLKFRFKLFNDNLCKMSEQFEMHIRFGFSTIQSHCLIPQIRNCIRIE